MKRLILLATMALAAALAVAPAASAQLYIGGGYTVFQADVDDDDVNLGAVMGRVGYEFLPVLAVEGEAAIGVQDDDFDVLGTNVDIGIDNEVGGFVVGKLPLLGMDLFGRVGYANFSIDADAAGASAAPDGSGMAYGGGVNFNILFLRARAEYTRYEVDDTDFDSLSVSALLKF
jgi:outer membrane immunogenic protein